MIRFVSIVPHLMRRVEDWTSTSSLLHISLASRTRESRMLCPSLELVSMKIALKPRSIHL